jgi:hypothetical protein
MTLVARLRNFPGNSRKSATARPTGVADPSPSSWRETGPIALLLGMLAKPPQLSVLQEPDAWSAVTSWAERFGVAEPVAFTVRPHVPAVYRFWRDGILASSWGHHERNLRDLEWIAGLLEADGIVPLALKGPALARRHYEPAFLRRPSLDLDLAVRGKDLERACRILVRAGYRLRMPVAEARNRTHHVELSHSCRRHLELHFRLSHGPGQIVLDGGDQLLHARETAVTDGMPGIEHTERMVRRVLWEMAYRP